MRDHPDGDGVSRDQHLHSYSYTTFPLVPIAMTPEEYDKLSPEEREIKDREDRAREQREQAGIEDYIYCSDYPLNRT